MKFQKPTLNQFQNLNLNLEGRAYEIIRELINPLTEIGIQSSHISLIDEISESIVNCFFLLFHETNQ